MRGIPPRLGPRPRHALLAACVLVFLALARAHNHHSRVHPSIARALRNAPAIRMREFAVTGDGKGSFELEESKGDVQAKDPVPLSGSGPDDPAADLIPSDAPAVVDVANAAAPPSQPGPSPLDDESPPVPVASSPEPSSPSSTSTSSASTDSVITPEGAEDDQSTFSCINFGPDTVPKYSLPDASSITGSILKYTSPVAVPKLPAAYLSHYYGATWSYNLAVNPSTPSFDIVLGFAEVYQDACDAGPDSKFREFTVSVPGKSADVDVMSSVGCGKAKQLYFQNIPSSQGSIKISFNAVKENAMLSVLCYKANDSPSAPVPTNDENVTPSESGSLPTTEIAPDNSAQTKAGSGGHWESFGSIITLPDGQVTPTKHPIPTGPDVVLGEEPVFVSSTDEEPVLSSTDQHATPVLVAAPPAGPAMSSTPIPSTISTAKLSPTPSVALTAAVPVSAPTTVVGVTSEVCLNFGSNVVTNYKNIEVAEATGASGTYEVNAESFPTLPAAYLSHMYGKHWSYKLNVDSAKKYTVTAGFAEIFTDVCSQGSGARTFTFSVGSASSPIDAYDAKGECGSIYQLRFDDVEATDGVITVTLDAQVENAMLSTLCYVAVGTSGIPPATSAPPTSSLATGTTLPPTIAATSTAPPTTTTTSGTFFATEVLGTPSASSTATTETQDQTIDVVLSTFEGAPSGDTSAGTVPTTSTAVPTSDDPDVELIIETPESSSPRADSVLSGAAVGPDSEVTEDLPSPSNDADIIFTAGIPQTIGNLPSDSSDPSAAPTVDENQIAAENKRQEGESSPDLSGSPYPKVPGTNIIEASLPVDDELSEISASDIPIEDELIETNFISLTVGDGGKGQNDDVQNGNIGESNALAQNKWSKPTVTTPSPSAFLVPEVTTPSTEIISVESDVAPGSAETAVPLPTEAIAVEPTVLSKPPTQIPTAVPVPDTPSSSPLPSVSATAEPAATETSIVTVIVQPSKLPMATVTPTPPIPLESVAVSTPSGVQSSGSPIATAVPLAKSPAASPAYAKETHVVAPPPWLPNIEQPIASPSSIPVVNPEPHPVFQSTVAEPIPAAIPTGIPMAADSLSSSSPVTVAGTTMTFPVSGSISYESNHPTATPEAHTPNLPIYAPSQEDSQFGTDQPHFGETEPQIGGGNDPHVFEEDEPKFGSSDTATITSNNFGGNADKAPTFVADAVLTAVPVSESPTTSTITFDDGTGSGQTPAVSPNAIPTAVPVSESDAIPTAVPVTGSPSTSTITSIGDNMDGGQTPALASDAIPTAVPVTGSPSTSTITSIDDNMDGGLTPALASDAIPTAVPVTESPSTSTITSIDDNLAGGQTLTLAPDAAPTAVPIPESPSTSTVTSIEDSTDGDQAPTLASGAIPTAVPLTESSGAIPTAVPVTESSGAIPTAVPVTESSPTSTITSIDDNADASQTPAFASDAIPTAVPVAGLLASSTITSIDSGADVDQTPALAADAAPTAVPVSASPTSLSSSSGSTNTGITPSDPSASLGTPGPTSKALPAVAPTAVPVAGSSETLSDSNDGNSSNVIVSVGDAVVPGEAADTTAAAPTAVPLGPSVPQSSGSSTATASPAIAPLAQTLGGEPVLGTTSSATVTPQPLTTGTEPTIAIDPVASPAPLPATTPLTPTSAATPEEVSTAADTGTTSTVSGPSGVVLDDSSSDTTTATTPGIEPVTDSTTDSLGQVPVPPSPTPVVVSATGADTVYTASSSPQPIPSTGLVGPSTVDNPVIEKPINDTEIIQTSDIQGGEVDAEPEATVEPTPIAGGATNSAIGTVEKSRAFAIGMGILGTLLVLLLGICLFIAIFRGRGGTYSYSSDQYTKYKPDDRPNDMGFAGGQGQDFEDGLGGLGDIGYGDGGDMPTRLNSGTAYGLGQSDIGNGTYGQGQAGYGQQGQSEFNQGQTGYGQGQTGYGQGQTGYDQGQSGYGFGQTGYGSTGETGPGGMSQGAYQQHPDTFNVYTSLTMDQDGGAARQADVDGFRPDSAIGPGGQGFSVDPGDTYDDPPAKTPGHYAHSGLESESYYAPPTDTFEQYTGTFDTRQTSAYDENQKASLFEGNHSITPPSLDESESSGNERRVPQAASPFVENADTMRLPGRSESKVYSRDSTGVPVVRGIQHADNATYASGIENGGEQGLVPRHDALLGQSESGDVPRRSRSEDALLFQSTLLTSAAGASGYGNRTALSDTETEMSANSLCYNNCASRKAKEQERASGSTQQTSETEGLWPYWWGGAKRNCSLAASQSMGGLDDSIAPLSVERKPGASEIQHAPTDFVGLGSLPVVPRQSADRLAIGVGGVCGVPVRERTVTGSSDADPAQEVPGYGWPLGKSKTVCNSRGSDNSGDAARAVKPPAGSVSLAASGSNTAKAVATALADDSWRRRGSAKQDEQDENEDSIGGGGVPTDVAALRRRREPYVKSVATRLSVGTRTPSPGSSVFGGRASGGSIGSESGRTPFSWIANNGAT